MRDELQFYEMFSQPVRPQEPAAPLKLTDLGLRAHARRRSLSAPRACSSAACNWNPSATRCAPFTPRRWSCAAATAPPLTEMRAASEGGNASVRTLCMAAQFYHMARMPRKSRQMAMRAVRHASWRRGVAHAHPHAGRTGAGPRGGGVRPPGHAGNALRPPAFARARRGACCARAAPLAQAAKFWERIARIDPEDTVAAYYLQAASGGNAWTGRRPDTPIRCPGRRPCARLNYVADVLSAALRRSWKRPGGRTRSSAACSSGASRWKTPQFRRAAVTALAALDERRGRGHAARGVHPPGDLLRYETQRARASALARRGHRAGPCRRASTSATAFCRTRMILLPAPAHRAPAGLPLRLRGAGGRLRPQRHAGAGADHAARAQPPPSGALRRGWRIPAYAAALTYCYLSMRGEKPSFRILCRQFGSAFRTNRVLRRPHCERAGGKGR